MATFACGNNFYLQIMYACNSGWNNTEAISCIVIPILYIALVNFLEITVSVTLPEFITLGTYLENMTFSCETNPVFERKSRTL